MPLSSVPIIDISNNQIGLTAGENVYVDLSTFKYGSGSVFFSGSANSDIKFSSSPKFGFSTGDFSMEMWINPQPSPLTYTTLFSVGSASNGILMRLNSLSGDNLYIAGTEYNWGAGSIKNNEWSHIVLSRELSVVKVFVNGSIKLSSFNGSNLGDSKDLIIGNSKSNPTEYYKGYIDDIHIVNSATFYPVATLSGNEIGKNIAWYTNGVKSTPAQAATQAGLSGVGDGVIGEFGSFYTTGSAASPEEIVGYIDFSGFGDGITGLSGKLYSNGNAYTGQGTSDIGVNGTWYTEGFVSSPSQAATQSNFTGQGDGIIGDDNVWYTDGIESTPTEAALQANYSGLGNGIIGENDVWYLNGVTANAAEIAQLTNFTGLGNGTIGDSSVWYYDGQQSTTEQAAAQQLALDNGFTGKGDGTVGILNEWYTSGNKSNANEAADQRAVEANLTGYGNGTIGRNGVYYNDGIAYDPNTLASILSFTGLGDGIIGNSGTWYTNGSQSTPAEAVIQANFTGQGNGTIGESGTWYTSGSQSTPAQAAAQSNFTGQGNGTIGVDGTWYTGGGISTPAQAAAQSNFTGKGNGTIGINNVWYTIGNPSNNSQILAQASNLTGLGGEVKPVEINEVRVSTFNGVIQTNNSPLSDYPTEASFYFNSSNSNIMNLSGYDGAVFDTGDFTIELWFKLNVINTYSPLVLKGTGYNTAGGWTNDWQLFIYSPTNQIWFTRYSDVEVSRTFSYTPIANVWTHLALCKKNGILTAYINGVSLGSQTDTTNYFDNLDSGMQLGASVMANAWQYLNGSVTNVRVVAGKALYLSNFTVPTYPLSLTSGTGYKNYKLPSAPTCVSDITPFSGVNAEDGSLYFLDGDFLTKPKSSDTDIPSGTFTIETWVRLNNTTGSRTIVTNYGGPFDGWVISILNGVPRVNLSGDAPDIVCTTTLQANTWYHIAVAGSPGSYKMFINGIQEGSTFTGGTVLNGGALYVGKLVAGVTDYDYFNGYISNLRIVNGTALYTSNFTAPTAPLSSVENTSLLLKAPYSPLTYSNFAYLSSASPFGVGIDSSIYLYGQAINIPYTSNDPTPSVNNILTYELWMYTLDMPGPGNSCRLIMTGPNSSTHSLIWLTFGPNGNLAAGIPWHSGVVGINTPDNAIQVNTWHHVAYTLNGSNASIFVDGKLKARVSNFTRPNPAKYDLRIGYVDGSATVNHVYRGYISNFRLTKGIELYTSDFDTTAPISPLAPLSSRDDTLILMKHPYDTKFIKNYNTPFLLKGVTNGLPDVWYTNGNESTPNQIALQTNFTGQGNDIIGTNGVWYTNGQLSTPAQVAAQTNFTGQGNGTIGVNGTWYINGSVSTSTQVANYRAEEDNLTGMGDGVIGLNGRYYVTGYLSIPEVAALQDNLTGFGDGFTGLSGLYYKSGKLGSGVVYGYEEGNLSNSQPSFAYSCNGTYGYGSYQYDEYADPQYTYIPPEPQFASSYSIQRSYKYITLQNFEPENSKFYNTTTNTYLGYIETTLNEFLQLPPNQQYGFNISPVDFGSDCGDINASDSNITNVNGTPLVSHMETVYFKGNFVASQGIVNGPLHFWSLNSTNYFQFNPDTDIHRGGYAINPSPYIGEISNVYGQTILFNKNNNLYTGYNSISSGPIFEKLMGEIGSYNITFYYLNSQNEPVSITFSSLHSLSSNTEAYDALINNLAYSESYLSSLFTFTDYVNTVISEHITERNNIFSDTNTYGSAIPPNCIGLGQQNSWYTDGVQSTSAQAAAQRTNYTGRGTGTTGTSGVYYLSGVEVNPLIMLPLLSNYTGIGNGTNGISGAWYLSGGLFTGIGNGTLGVSGRYYEDGFYGPPANGASYVNYTGLGNGIIGLSSTFYTNGSPSTGNTLITQQNTYAYQVNHTGWGTNVAGYGMYYYINGVVEVASVSGITSNYIGIGNGLTGRNGYYYHYGVVDKNNDIAYRNYIYYTVTRGNGLDLLNNTQLVNWDWRNYSYSLFLGTGLIGENNTYYLISPALRDPQHKDIIITQSDWPSLSTQGISSITVSNSAYIVPDWNPYSDPFDLFRETSRKYMP